MARPLRIRSIVALGLLLVAVRVQGQAPTPTPCVITVTSASDSGAGTLRDAITTANGLAGPCTINFTISGCPGNHCTITLATALTQATATALTIDGTTQAGSSCGDILAGTPPVPHITIDVNNITFGGLEMTGAGSIVKGLEVMNVAGQTTLGYGIRLVGGTSTATCNVSHNNWGGIVANSNGNTSGGTNAGDGNWAYSNGITGFTLLGDNNIAQGNNAGLNGTGTSALPNHQSGVYVEGGDGNLVGGATASARNLISGNGVVPDEVAGVVIKLGSTNTTIQNNYVGADVSGNVNAGVCNLDTNYADQGTGTTFLNNVECPTPTPGVGCCAVSGAVNCIDSTIVPSPIHSVSDCQAILDANIPGSTALYFNGTVDCDPVGDTSGTCATPIPTDTPTVGVSATPTPSPTVTPTSSPTPTLTPTSQTPSATPTHTLAPPGPTADSQVLTTNCRAWARGMTCSGEHN